jgi:hypothetical protein
MRRRTSFDDLFWQSAPTKQNSFDIMNQHWWRMNEWMNECMDEWMNECMDEWMNECMDEWMNECMDEWMNE